MEALLAGFPSDKRALVRLMEAAVKGRELPCRPLSWMIALGVVVLPDDAPGPFESVLAAALAQLQAKREMYKADKLKLMANPADVDDDPLLNNPLTAAESSPWADFFSHQELVVDIHKDIDRLFPEGCSTYFHNDRLRNMLSAILFVWCVQHPALSYRQVCAANCAR